MPSRCSGPGRIATPLHARLARRHRASPRRSDSSAPSPRSRSRSPRTARSADRAHRTPSALNARAPTQARSTLPARTSSRTPGSASGSPLRQPLTNSIRSRPFEARSTARANGSSSPGAALKLASRRTRTSRPAAPPALSVPTPPHPASNDAAPNSSARTGRDSEDPVMPTRLHTDRLSHTRANPPDPQGFSLLTQPPDQDIAIKGAAHRRSEQSAEMWNLDTLTRVVATGAGRGWAGDRGAEQRVASILSPTPPGGCATISWSPTSSPRPQRLARQSWREFTRCGIDAE